MLMPAILTISLIIWSIKIEFIILILGRSFIFQNASSLKVLQKLFIEFIDKKIVQLNKIINSF